MSEFDLIALIQGIIQAKPGNGILPAVVGIGDDAAVLQSDSQAQWVVTMDTLVSGIHFPAETTPGEIGFKALAVNLSDLAAMGADPAWFFLSLTLPNADAGWLEAFAEGMGALAAKQEIQLAGGDMTRGHLSITVTALGLVPRGAALLRSGARANDLVLVSGTPGLAALGLWQWQHKLPTDESASLALNRPVPRLKLGRELRWKARGCIDISDGLAADLGHVTKASGVGAEIWLDRLPQHKSFSAVSEDQRWALQLTGGDDYELCFGLPAEMESDLPGLAARAGVHLTPVGRFTSGSGVRFLRDDGTEFLPKRRGFDHFAN